MRLRAYLLLSLLLTSCSDQKQGSDSQTFAEAMQMICTGQAPGLSEANPAERQNMLSKWLSQEVTNAKARTLLASVADASPAERTELLASAITKAGLDSCPNIDAPRAAIADNISAASVAMPLPPLEKRVSLTISKEAILVEGDPIVSIYKGDVDASEQAQDVLGGSVPKVSRFLEAVARQAESHDIPPKALNIGPDKDTPVRLVKMVAHSAIKAGYEDLYLVAQHGAELGALPLRLPRPASAQSSREGDGLAMAIEGMSADEKRPPPSLQLVLTVLEDRALLWSISGLEGSLSEPAFELARKTGTERSFDWKAINDKLVEIVDRRWRDQERPEKSYEIVVMVDGKLPYSLLAEAMVAVRAKWGATSDDALLFPSVVLSTGFQ